MRKICTTKNINKSKLGAIKYILFAVAGILAISSIFMTVETTTSGLEVSELRQKQTELFQEKRSLENALVRSLSLNDLQKKGDEMGFVKPQTLVFVSGEKVAVAKLP